MPEGSDAVNELVRFLAERHRGAEPKRPTPRHREQDLVRDPRFNPDDWQKLRAASEWSESERQQMDADFQRLGGNEDHAYNIWKPRWKKKWVDPPRGSRC